MSDLFSRWFAESTDRLIATDGLIARGAEEKDEDEEEHEEDKKEEEEEGEDDGYSE